MNEIFARLCSGKIISDDHTGVDGPKHKGVVEHGHGLIQEGGMAAYLETRRLFPGQLPDLDRYWVKAAIYMNDCLNTQPTTAARPTDHHSSTGAHQTGLPLQPYNASVVSELAMHHEAVHSAYRAK